MEGEQGGGVKMKGDLVTADERSSCNDLIITQQSINFRERANSHGTTSQWSHLNQPGKENKLI